MTYAEHTAYLNSLIDDLPKNDYVRVAEKVKRERKRNIKLKIRYAIEYAIGSVFVLGFFAFLICAEGIVEMIF